METFGKSLYDGVYGRRALLLYLDGFCVRGTHVI